MFNKNKILIIGDLMLDTYLIGTVNRISPEAPVPIVNIKEKYNRLGGASNVALNIKNLGSEPIICSIVGNDSSAKKLKNLLLKNNIRTDFILSSIDRKTTNKTRIIGNNNHISRYDDEITDDLNFNDYETLSRNLEIIIDRENIDIILIQDYDKGLIDRNLIEKILNLSETENILVIVDPKKRNFNFYKNVKLIKPNFKELKEGINMHDSNLSVDEILKIGCKTLHDKNIENIFVTLSSNGIYMSYDFGNKNRYVKGLKRNVSDVSGAGDTVISVVSTLINSGLPIERIAEISNIAGGLVCEEIGVVPVDKEKLLKEI